MPRQGRSGIPGASPVTSEGPTELRLAEINAHTGRPGRGREEQHISVTLIDPKPLTRRSIAEMLTKVLPDCVLIAARSCEELLDAERAPSGCLHLVIVYIRSAGVMDGWVQNALQFFRRRLPNAPVIVLSDREDINDINAALSCGVRGYIPSSVECEVAFAALRLISAGGTFVPADTLRSATVKQDIGLDDERPGRPHPLDLTPRELSVVDLLREGKPNKLIAAQLDMQESTVKVHVRNILKKLHAANRTHAACVANRLLG